MLGERIAVFKAETIARGRSYDPMQVVVARDTFVADSGQDKEAAIERNSKVHARTLSVSRAPNQEGGSHILAYPHTAAQQRESPLIGTPDEIASKLTRLRLAGVEYVILHCAGSRDSLRRFAREIMPHFAQRPVDNLARHNSADEPLESTPKPKRGKESTPWIGGLSWRQR